MSLIYGRNPLLEALQAGASIQKIYIQHGLQGNKIRRIYSLAREQSIPVVTATQQKLRQLAGDVAHQGVIASIAPVKLHEFDALTEIPGVESQRTLLVVDRIQDPHNLGAVLRSAEVFGAAGLLMSLRSSAPVTETVVKTSAGAALNIPIYIASNLAAGLERLKTMGFWIYGAALEGEPLLWDVDFRRDCAIVIGNEAAGIRPLLRKKCDVLFHIPQSGSTQSLNASVAAGVVLSEMFRQRSTKS